MDSNQFIKAPDGGITVLALKELLDTLIEQGKGDYKLAFDINEYDGIANQVSVCDDSHYLDYLNKTVIVG